MAKLALCSGWTISVGGVHLKWKSPTGAMVVTSSTPSDRRTKLNVRAQLRQRGLAIP